MTADRPPSSYELERIISAAMSSIEELKTQYGQVFETEDDVLAALREEGIGVDEVLRRLGRAALDAKANAAAVNARIKDLSIRGERFERQMDTYRDTAAAIMEALLPPNDKGGRTFRDPEFTLSLAPGKPKVVITDQNALPGYLLNEVTTWVPDKRLIGVELEAGHSVPGATMSNGSSVLTVRSK